MPRRLLSCAFAAMTILVLPARDAAACFCGGLATPCASLWGRDRAPVLFEGTVQSIETRVLDEVMDVGGTSRVRQREMREVRFRDVRPLLGRRVTTVLTGTGGGDCGYARFVVGERFVVHGTDERVGLTTGTCSFTAPVAEAREILDYVAGLSAPSAGARIDGTVVLAKREHIGLPSISTTPLPGVTLQLEGPARGSAVSDAQGRYSFAPLPAGRYEVTIVTDRDDLVKAGPLRQSVELAHVHACATPYAEFFANGTVTGTVVDVDGRPVSAAQVSLRAADIEGQEYYEYDTTSTDADGRYRFQSLGEGRYAVGVNLERGMRTTSPWMPAMATDERGAPAVVTLAHAALVEVAPIVVRAPASAMVTGRLVRADGQPVANARVRATSAGERYRQFGDGVDATTGDDGRFSFALGAGAAYRIGTWLDTGSAEMDAVVVDGMHVTLVLTPRR
ncbi:MAG: carboxypeptidase regulatory-like domain-containing protein [Vicinamibacterales bacterium]